MKIKSTLLLASLGLMTFTGVSQSWTEKTIDMKPGFTDEVFYSMANGEAGRSAINNWDLSYSTYARDNTVRLNHMNGWELYAYPNGDTASWATADTAGMSAWKPLYNKNDSMPNGAFNISFNKTDGWDFSWGRYNVNTHTVVGDSMYILVQKNQAMQVVAVKKLWLVSQTATNGNLTIRYANYDNSSDVKKEFINTGTDYYFNYIDLGKMETVMREPKRSTWDLSFTRYYQYLGPYSPIAYYPSTGVYTNENTKIAAVSKMKPQDIEIWQVGNMLKTDHFAIGADWKYQDQSHQTHLTDSLTYFVKRDTGTSNPIHAFYFTAYEGASTGVVKINQRDAFTASIKNAVSTKINVYPNPANNLLHLDLKGISTGEVTIVNSLGATVYNEVVVSGNNTMDISALANGIYTVRVASENGLHLTKVIVNR